MKKTLLALSLILLCFYSLVNNTVSGKRRCINQEAPLDVASATWDTTYNAWKLENIAFTPDITTPSVFVYNFDGLTKIGKNIIVYEDGKPLKKRLHIDVLASYQQHGKYSFLPGETFKAHDKELTPSSPNVLYFTSPDGSDPRTNARTYTVALPFVIKPFWRVVLLTLLFLSLSHLCALVVADVFQCKKYDIFYSPKEVVPGGNPLLLSSACAFLLIFLIYTIFTPYWMTNDDPAMSMLAHGLAGNAGSPFLIFQNVIWGNLIHYLPTIHGVYGYSLVQLGVLFILCLTFFYYLRQESWKLLPASVLAVLLLYSPVIMPQFTLNAGFLAICAVLYFFVYTKNRKKRFLFFACLTALMGFLIRNFEVLLVAFIVLPILPWKFIRKDRNTHIALVALCVLFALVTFVDRRAYSTKEWQRFWDFQTVRIQLIDLGKGELLKAKPELLAKYGYSKNDIELLQAWFFYDPQLADPVKLKNALSEVEFYTTDVVQQDTTAAIKALFEEPVWALTFVALFLCFLYPSKRLISSWLLFVFSIAVMGALGRPGVLRVYIPMLSMLIFMPFLVQTKNRLSRKIPLHALFLVLCLTGVHVYTVTKEVQGRDRVAQKQQRLFSGILDASRGTLIMMPGNSVDLAYLDTVLKRYPVPANMKIYFAGWGALLPTSAAMQDELLGENFVTVFTERTIFFLANKQFMQKLDVYCQEHFQGHLTATSRLDMANEGMLWEVQCSISK